MPPALLNFWTSVLHTCSQAHGSMQNFINSTDKNQDNETKVRKNMLLIYIYFLTLYFLSFLILNPSVPATTWIIYMFLPLLQIYILKVSGENCNINYFLTYLALSLYFHARKDMNALKILGVAFICHQQYFLSLKDVMLRRLFVILSFFSCTALIFSFSHCSAFDFDAENDITIANFKYLVVFLMLPNYVCAKYLIDAYEKLLYLNKEIKSKFENCPSPIDSYDQTLAITSLEKEIKDLKTDIQARELFIASFSHEIRNSLNAVLGNIELLKLEITNTKWLKQLETCQTCGEVMLDQINDVLDMAKINAEKLELNPVPDDVFKIIERMWNISIIRIKQKGLRGELYITNNFPRYLEIDAHRLTQVLLNLVGNASKFTKEGFVKIVLSWHENRDSETLKSPNQEFLRLVEKMIYKSQTNHLPLTEQQSQQGYDISTIECLNSPYTLNLRGELEKRRFSPRVMSQMLASNSIFISSDNERAISKMQTKYTYRPKTKGIIKVEVIDSGCGMSRTSMQRLFQPFTQADASITNKFGGTGLGLYITKRIIEAMNGEIQVYSQQNVGSNFCFLFPACTADGEEYFERQLHALKNRGLNKSHEHLRGLFLEIVESDKNINTLKTHLSNLHVLLDTVNDSQEALELYKRKTPGYYAFIMVNSRSFNASFCKNIRKFEADNFLNLEVPIIFILEKYTESEREISLDPKGEIRISNIFKKPLLLNDYKDAIQIILDRWKDSKIAKESLPRILVVDDDPFNAALAQDYLQKHNIECAICSNGKEAVAKTYKEKFEIILMDLEMPGMDGYTAAKLIREKYPHIIILGVTGHKKERVLQKAKDHGINNVETKPLDFKKILAIVLETAN